MKNTSIIILYLYKIMPPVCLSVKFLSPSFFRLPRLLVAGSDKCFSHGHNHTKGSVI